MEYISYILVFKICFSIILPLDAYAITDSIRKLEVLDNTSELEKNQSTNKERRSLAVNRKDQLWDGGIIPYEFDKVFTGAQHKLIKQAMQFWEQSTCLQFVPRIKNVHKHYTLITKKDCGCCSTVGKYIIKKSQFISLNDNCMYRYTILHELGHTIGLYHEHMRPDRDEYVEIITTNIMSGDEFNFEKMTKNQSTSLGQPYDYSSIMHYWETVSAKDSYLYTMKPLKKINGEWPILGRGYNLSEGDVVTTNLLYHCPECGGTFLRPRGIISLPSEPTHSQPSIKRCEWTIKAAEAQRIKLSIKSSGIPESSYCLTDYLEIQNNRENNDVIAHYCGETETTLIVNTNILKILLVYTQYENNSVNVTIEYEAMCGKNIYVGSNEIFYLESPNYPGPYVANRECYWYITAPEYYSISVEFYDFDIEESPECKYDYLEVRDGDNYRAPLIGNYCGQHDNLTISSIGRFMFLRFVPDESLNKNGFSAAITARPIKMHLHGNNFSK